MCQQAAFTKIHVIIILFKGTNLLRVSPIWNAMTSLRKPFGDIGHGVGQHVFTSH